jgi:L,D-peptidoglycan transpeptidase YkuD (ErfK/YbiS/YcfS/YnhG family)
MDIAVTARSISPQLGTLAWTAAEGRREVKCALGRGGIVADKREGDGATPIGRFALRRVFYRADRLSLAATALPASTIEPGDGWCDDPASPDYNRFVRLPIAANHEHLWRLDEIYDIVVVLGHNDDPPVPGAGSAIFLHVARADYGPTQGCVAVARADLLRLLAECGAESFLTVS